MRPVHAGCRWVGNSYVDIQSGRRFFSISRWILILVFVFAGGGLFRRATQSRFRPGLPIEILVNELLVIAVVEGFFKLAGFGGNGLFFEAQGLEYAKDTEETCHAMHQGVAIFLHPERLPFDDVAHRALNARFLADNAMNVIGVAVSAGRG